MIGQVLAGSDAAVSAPTQAPAMGGEVVLVAVPVHDAAGQTAYALAAAIRTERLAGLLWGQQLSLGWFAAINDARGGQVARVPAHAVNLNGPDWLAVTERSALTGWTVRIGAPRDGSDANLRGTLGTTVGFGFLVLGGSVVLALTIARRILRPVQALTSIAQPFLRDRPTTRRVFGISELDALYQALDVLSGELEKTQARFLSFFSAAPVMLFVLDENERLIAVNDAWLRTLGYAADEVLGRTPWEFHTSASGAQVRLVAWPEFLRVGSLDRVPGQYVTKAGDVREVLVSLRADRDLEGHILRTIGAIQDVTEQRRAEAGLARAVDEAERANDAKTRFLAAASHDLRQPLQALSFTSAC
ncbi:MAG: PAS domain S-box protein [Magnetospirillum sp.]|nr:PAS domain S-box protein [Magnetospirillum sp.]